MRLFFTTIAAAMLMTLAAGTASGQEANYSREKLAENYLEYMERRL